MKVYTRRFLTETDAGDLVCAEVLLILTPDEEAALLASYDAGSASSPPAADCRAIARPIADQLSALPLLVIP